MPFKKPFAPSSEQIAHACQKPLHPEAMEGIRLYNEGKYFLAHEALEIAWRAEPEPDRRLYQGILQAGIAFMHARNQYEKGVLSMYERCQVWLSPWPDHCRTINIGQLKSDLKQLVEQVITLGPDKLIALEPKIFTQIKRVEQ